MKSERLFIRRKTEIDHCSFQFFLSDELEIMLGALHWFVIESIFIQVALFKLFKVRETALPEREAAST